MIVGEVLLGFFAGFAGWQAVKLLWSFRPRKAVANKQKFYVMAEYRVDKDDSPGILVWVKRSSGNFFPSWATHQREWRDKTFGDEDFRIIDFIQSSDPNAEEKILDAVIKARQLAADWENPHPSEIRELALVAQRAIER